MTDVGQIRHLAPTEARRGYPVRFRGVVTYYYSPSDGFMVVQDPTGGISVDVGGIRLAVARGERVEIEGVTGPGDSVPIVLNATVRPLGSGEMPAARPVSLDDLASGASDYEWVEVQGVVRSAHVEHDGTLRLDMAAGGRRFVARLAEYGEVEFDSIIDAGVRVRGVASAVRGVTGELIRIEVLVPDRSHLLVDEAPDPSTVPVRSIAQVPPAASRQASLHRVRIRGAVVEQKDGRDLLVRDDTGSMWIRSAHVVAFAAGEAVEVLGFPSGEGDTAILDDATLNRLAEDSTSGRPSLLTTAAAVRELVPGEAARGYPVRLRAVVTYYDPGWSILWVQDATAGIYVDGNGLKPFDIRPGQLVEVEGRSDPGGFAPQIVDPRIRVIGPGSMPPDPRLSLKDLLTGRYDSQWVEVEGVVRSITEREGRVWLELTDGLYHFRAHSVDVSDRAFLEGLAGSRVRVRGACVTNFNRKRQLLGVDVYVPDRNHISVSIPGLKDPFSLPSSPIAGLLQFHPRGDVRERVKVRGTVTLQQRGGVFITDGSGGAFVEADPGRPLAPGDEIEAVGVPAGGDYAPLLRHSIVRRLGAATPPAPVLLSQVDAATGNHDAQLISLDAYLLEHFVISGEHVLALQAGKSVFTAHLAVGTVAAGLDGLRRGSLIRATGVCSVRVQSFAGPGVPTSFRILLRSPEDVVVRVNGPWWSVRHTALAGALMGVVFLAALAWGATLNRRVGTQTEIIRRELERKALLERRYQDLVENANDIVYVQDLDGRVTSINEAGQRTLGYPREEVLARPLLRLVAPEHRELAREKAAEVLAGKRPPAFELDALARDGNRVTLEVSARLMELEGTALGMQVIARDITGRKTLEAQLHQSQKMEAVGRLAGGMAHDFNNLLGVVTGHGELLRRALPATSPLRRRIDEILKVTDRGAGLIRQLLAFSRKQVLRPQSLDLGSVVAETTSMLRRVLGEDVVLETVLRPGLWSAEADAGQIQQVLMNLALNARDAMPGGGRLTIEADNATLTEDYVERHLAVRPGRYVRLTVTDTGTGMDAATRARIFEPFFTTKPVGKGTGLGLATVYGIVKQSGGDIWVYSEPGKGTTFKVYLPQSAAAHESAAPPVAMPEVVAGGSEVVLVVEDDDALRGVVREVLEEGGYRVLEAPQPQKALQVCEEHQGPIDVVLTDLVMPGMSGRELVTHLAQLRPRARVLYMSGYADAAVEGHGMVEPGTAFIEKPFSTHALARKLRDVLDARC